MAGLEVGTTIKNVVFCDQNFSQKHNLKANSQSTSKTDLLFDIIPDLGKKISNLQYANTYKNWLVSFALILVRPENFDNVADRDTTANKRKLFLRQSDENEESTESEKGMFIIWKIILQ